MKAIKLLVAIAITVVVSTSLITMKSIDDNVDMEMGIAASGHEQKAATMAAPARRASRFLAEQKNPRAADHCKKDNEICYLLEGKNSTCCNNKCMDLGYDRHNCGACRNKCKFTETCCRGECVNLSFDKRHCGKCNNRCMLPEGYCMYGVCDYA